MRRILIQMQHLLNTGECSRVQRVAAGPVFLHSGTQGPREIIPVTSAPTRKHRIAEQSADEGVALMRMRRPRNTFWGQEMRNTGSDVLTNDGTQRYRELFENSADAIFLIDITPEERFRFVEINPAHARLIGLGNADIAGKYIEDIAPNPQVAEAAMASFRRCIVAGHAIQVDDVLDFSGGPRRFDTTLVPMRDDSGDIFCIAGIVRDVSAQKQAQEQFELINFALNHVKDAVFLIDEQARLHYVNDESCRVLGYSREELLRLGVEDVDPDWPSERWPEHWRQLVQSGSLLFEGRHKAKDGRIFPAEISANYFEFGGRGYNLTLVRDIAERKRTEQRLRMLDMALENVREPAYIIDRSDMRFLYVNNEACRALGYSRGELLAMTVFDIDPDYTPEVAAVVRHQADIVGSLTLERRHKAKDGHIFPVEVYTSVFDHDGKRVSVVLSRDISERKRAEEALQSLNETLERRVRDEVAKNREKDHLLIQQSRLAAMGEMFHNIAHQWRQPLCAVGAVFANIKDSYAYGELTPESLDELVNKGTDIVHRMSATIDDFRDFFRPDKEKSDFPIARSLHEVEGILGAALAQQGIELSAAVEAGAVAHGLDNEFSQVLLNVVNNAKEAIVLRRPAQGRITVQAARRGGMVEVRVADNGGGIPVGVLPRIFEPYFTTKEKGTGIGLYMSKMIIEGNMGGEISAGNTGDGAEIVIRLPLGKD